MFFPLGPIVGSDRWCFVEASLSGVMGMRKVALGSQLVGDNFMVRKFPAIAEGQSEDAFVVVFQALTDSICDSLCCFTNCLDGNDKSSFTLDKCHKD